MSAKAAEKIVADLQAKRARLVAHGTEIGDRRAAIAYAAHTGEAAAGRALTELHREEGEYSSQLASLDAAIGVAGNKLEKVLKHEASRADRESAQALKAEVKTFIACGEEIDEALIVIAETSVKMHKTLARIHQLGSPGPSFSQLDVLGKNCVLEGLRTSIWNRSFELLPSPNRHRLSDVVHQWCAMIKKNISSRLNADEEAA